jgi:hypothetical protein
MSESFKPRSANCRPEQVQQTAPQNARLNLPRFTHDQSFDNTMPKTAPMI